MANLWAFIDESKSRDYVVVATHVPEDRFSEIRKGLNSLRMTGQRRIHFVDESNTNRLRILRYMERLELDVRVWVATGLHPVEARGVLLNEMFRSLMNENVTVYLLERDETVSADDLKVFTHVRGALTQQSPSRLLFLSSSQEPLLWISDAYAWSFQRGGDWRNRITVRMQQLS